MGRDIGGVSSPIGAITDVNWPSRRGGGGVGIFRKLPPLDLTCPASDSYGSFSGRTYVYVKNVGKALLIEEGLRYAHNKIPDAVKQLPETAQTTLMRAANVTSSAFSSVVETGKAVVGEGAKVLSPIKTAYDWGTWGFGFLPPWVKIVVFVVAGVTVYKIFWSRGSGGSSSSAAHINLNIHINGQSGGPVSIETTGDKKSSVKVTPANSKQSSLSASSFEPVTPQVAGKKLRCEPVGTALDGSVFLSFQTDTENYVPSTLFIYAWRIRRRLEKCKKDPVLSDMLKQEIATFLARKNTTTPEEVKNGYWKKYFLEANGLYERVYQEEFTRIKANPNIPHVPLHINRISESTSKE